MSQNEINSNAEQRYLAFALGTERYAIPLLSVREVIAMPEVTPVPNSPTHFLGIINLRGQVISVMDLRLKLGIKPVSTSETAVIICDVAGMNVGVVIDAVQSVLSPKPDCISERPQDFSRKAAEYVTGIYRADEDLILFLDIAKLIDSADRAAAKAA